MTMLRNNVVGKDGITLQMTVLDAPDKPDTNANDIIENAWWEWGKKGSASVCGSLSWRDVQAMAIEAVGRDGEVLVRKVKGWKGNKYRFALQIIEADHLDENLNRAELPGGNTIRMGVEVDQWGRPVAYHLLTAHPGDSTYTYGGNRYMRVPADEIIHLFIKERPTQTRGVPWMAPAMVRLNMLDGYAEAELTAARAEACKMGIIHTPTGEDYKGDDKDLNNNVTVDLEPGTSFQLPQGYTWTDFNPTHPNGNFAAFAKAMLRDVAAGTGVSYNMLAQDLESVSWSSLRQGVLDERDQYRCTQRWLAEHLHDNVFAAWLEMALLSGAVGLPLAKFDKFNVPTWHPRKFEWVDPSNEMQAISEALNMGVKTRTQVLAEQGLDLEETFAELAREKKLAEKYGLAFVGGGIKETTNANQKN